MVWVNKSSILLNYLCSCGVYTCVVSILVRVSRLFPKRCCLRKPYSAIGDIIAIARGGSISIGGSVCARGTANQARSGEVFPSIATNLSFDGAEMDIPIDWNTFYYHYGDNQMILTNNASPSQIHEQLLISVDSTNHKFKLIYLGQSW